MCPQTAIVLVLIIPGIIHCVLILSIYFEVSHQVLFVADRSRVTLNFLQLLVAMRSSTAQPTAQVPESFIRENMNLIDIGRGVEIPYFKEALGVLLGER